MFCLVTQVGLVAVNRTLPISIHRIRNNNKSITELGAFAVDLGLHAVRGPGRTPVQSYLLTVGQATAGIRFLF